MTGPTRNAILRTIAACIIAAGCSKHAGRTEYPVRGEVVALDTANNVVTISHEEIPHFMKPMTMRFQVKEKSTLRGVQVGDSVQTTLVVSEGASWIENIRIREQSQ